MPDLVSCIMLTVQGREEMATVARECFERQTYPNRELIVVGGEGCVGQKRNEAIRRSKGPIIAHWDDDDWSAPDRLEDQIARLQQAPHGITGYDKMLFRDEVRDCWWRFDAKRPQYALGTSLVYRRLLWESRRFQQFQVGEDNDFQKQRPPLAVDAEHRMWARIHNGNTSPKNITKEANWTKTPAPTWGWRNGYGIVILSRNASNLSACLEAIRKSGDQSPVWVVDDGLESRPDGSLYLDGVKPFVFARNANIGIRAVFADGYAGVVLCNDDAEVESAGGFAPLAQCRDGITSAAIKRMVGNPNQKPQGKGIRREKRTLAFVCCHIPRETWDAIGELDEGFTDYGGEDNDYCYRALTAGLNLYIHDGCVVDHGRLPSEFRGHGSRDISAALDRLKQKWGRIP